MVIVIRTKGVEACRGGAMLKLILFLIIFCGVITAAWILFLPAILTSTLQKRTGFNVKVQRLVFNPFNSRIEMEGFMIKNPLGFPQPDFVDVRSFYADMDMQSIFRKRPVINHMRIHVANLHLVRNSQGTLNTKLFYDRLVVDKTKSKADEKDAKKKSDSSAKEKEKQKEKEKEVPSGPPEVQYLIINLEIKFDRCVVIDHASRSPAPREYALNINQVYENVISSRQLLRPLAMKSLGSVGAAINGLLPGTVGSAMGAVTQPGADILTGNPKKAGDPLQNLVDALEETLKE